MKITLDLPSAITGGAVALTLGLVAGFSPQAAQIAPQRPASAVPLNGAQRPAARDLLLFRGNDPAFTVPAGRILVITRLATLGSSSSRGVLRVNGVQADVVGGPDYTWEFTEGGIGGWPFAAGTTIELVRRDNGNPASSFEWFTGYLEDA